MRLQEDPTTVSALRLALAADPHELPSAEAIKMLAEVIELRLREPEPVRLSVCPDTPQSLREAMLVDVPPDPRALRNVWEGIRRAVLSDYHASLESKSTPQVLDGIKPFAASANDVKRQRTISIVQLPARRGRLTALVAASVVMVSTLAAAGFKVFQVGPFAAEVTPNALVSESDTLKRSAPRGAKSSSRRLSTATETLSVATAAALPRATMREPVLVPTDDATAPARRANTSSKNSTVPSQREQKEASAQRDSSSVIAEINLLRPAWAELRAGRAEAALDIAREHAVLYPTGALAQEREVVQIQALYQLGRTKEAHRRATSFEQRFPDSPHRPLMQADSPLP